MKSLPGKLFGVLILVSAPSIVFAQSMKYLDWSAIHARNGVRKVTIEHIDYEQKAPKDTTIVAEVYLNSTGRPTEYVTYFAGGRLFSREFFQYQADTTLPHQLVSIHYASRETQWDTIPFILERDLQQRIARRELLLQNGHRGVAENYTYGPAGYLIQCDKERRMGQAWDQMEQISFLSQQQDREHRRENNLTYIYNMDGLLLIRNLYDAMGELRRVRKYSYDYNDTATE